MAEIQCYCDCGIDLQLTLQFNPTPPLFIFAFFGAASMAYGGSQAREQIGAVATSLHHSRSNEGSDLHHSSWQGQILDPLSEARDRTCNLMDTREIPF